jgi:hypothetical protein
MARRLSYSLTILPHKVANRHDFRGALSRL